MKFSGAGQIGINTELGKKILKLSRGKDVKNILEIGTCNGQGTTVCVMNGIINKKNHSTLFSIEGDIDKHRQALDFWGQYDTKRKLNLIYGLLHRENLPDMETAEKESKGYGWETLKKCHYLPEEKMIKNTDIPLINLDDYLNEGLDMVILDGGEYTTLGDYNIIKKHDPKIIILDDTKTFKCKDIRNKLLNKSNFNIHYDNDTERNGCSIFIKKK